MGSLDIRIEEHESETEVTPQAPHRALELLARWALRHGQKVLEDAGVDPENRVTAHEVKGYGGKNGSK